MIYDVHCTMLCIQRETDAGTDAGPHVELVGGHALILRHHHGCKHIHYVSFYPFFISFSSLLSFGR